MYTDKIYNEDCFETIRSIKENGLHIDMVLTSPPYNMTSRKGGYADTGRYDIYQDWKTEDEYLSWTCDLFNEIDGILNKNRSILYNFSYSIENPSLPNKLVVKIEEKTNFRLVDTIIWKKKCGLPFPANGKRLSRNWEYVFVFARKDEMDTYENNRQIKSISEKTGQKYYEATYNFVDAKNNDGKCPYNQATYSSELCEKLLNIYCKDGWVVFDPFIGSGTTAVACINSERNIHYIGSEISENQVNFANERINSIREGRIICHNQ